MADLGNLYFDILFRDKTAEQRKKLKAEITKDLQAKLDVGFDKKKLVGDMKTLLFLSSSACISIVYTIRGYCYPGYPGTASSGFICY